MAINFPSTPALNDIHTVNNTMWIWDGSAWTATGDVVGYTGSAGTNGYTGSAGAGYTGSAGSAGSIGYTGSAGTGGGGGGALNDLTDVTITTPTNGQVLKYDGANWVNGTDNSGTGSGTSESFHPFLLMGV